MWLSDHLKEVWAYTSRGVGATGALKSTLKVKTQHGLTAEDTQKVQQILSPISKVHQLMSHSTSSESGNNEPQNLNTVLPQPLACDEDWSSFENLPALSSR